MVASLSVDMWDIFRLEIRDFHLWVFRGVRGVGSVDNGRCDRDVVGTVAVAVAVVANKVSHLN